MIEFLSPEWVEQLDQKLKASGLRLDTKGDGESQSVDAESSIRSGDEGAVGSVAAGASVASSRLCVQNIVELPEPQKPFCYFITIDVGGATANIGTDENPSVTFTQPLDVAVAIAQHQRDTHAAFLMGEIKVEGDVTALLGLTETITELQQIISAANQTTRLDTR